MRCAGPSFNGFGKKATKATKRANVSGASARALQGLCMAAAEPLPGSPWLEKKAPGSFAARPAPWCVGRSGRLQFQKLLKFGHRIASIDLPEIKVANSVRQILHDLRFGM